MKKYLALLLIALMAVTVVSAAGVVSAAPVMKPLPAPNLVAPKNGATFPSERPWTVLLQWKPVDSAYLKEYKVEVQIYEPEFGEWSGGIGPLSMTTTNTYYQPDLSYIYGSAGQFRWRVIAVSTIDGFDSAPSIWRTFTFGTPPDVRLATPHVTSPANNIDVNVGMPLTFNWNPVPGASLYIMHREKLVDGVWKGDPPTIVANDQSLPFTTNSWTKYSAWNGLAGTYRWHVVAQNADYTAYSNPSTWRTFTVFE